MVGDHKKQKCDVDTHSSPTYVSSVQSAVHVYVYILKYIGPVYECYIEIISRSCKLATERKNNHCSLILFEGYDECNEAMLIVD